MSAGKSEVARYAVSKALDNDFVGMVPQEIGAWVRYEDHRSLLLDARADAASWETQCDYARKEWHACLLRAERAEALAGEYERDARRYRWLRDLSDANHLHVTCNDGHAPNYMTASEWIDTNPEWFSDDPSEEIQRMKDNNTIWCVQIYPDTPIGFHHWNAATLDTAIDTAIDAAGGRGET